MAVMYAGPKLKFANERSLKVAGTSNLVEKLDKLPEEELNIVSH